MFSFDDGSMVRIDTSNNNVVVTCEPDGSKIIISGFPTHKDAKSFVMFGDFEQVNNDFCTQSKLDLKWEYIG